MDKELMANTEGRCCVICKRKRFILLKWACAFDVKQAVPRAFTDFQSGCKVKK